MNLLLHFGWKIVSVALFARHRLGLVCRFFQAKGRLRFGRLEVFLDNCRRWSLRRALGLARLETKLVIDPGTSLAISVIRTVLVGPVFGRAHVGRIVGAGFARRWSTFVRRGIRPTHSRRLWRRASFRPFGRSAFWSIAPL